MTASEPNNEPVVDHEAETDVIAINRLRLPSGETLSSAEVDQFLRWRPATFVSIVGDRESGKTTLICALYDRFLKGPFSDYLFVGSRTVVALERRSHYSRVESGAAQPDTPRTSLSEGLTFIHLAVAPKRQVLERCDLLLSDRAGEAYTAARSKPESVRGLSELRIADRLVLLLDGARVSEPAERAGAMQSVRQTLRAFLDNGAVDGASRVQVVTTKLDVVNAAADTADIVSRLRDFRDRLRDDVAARLGHLSFWDIAARDPSGGLPPAHGLGPLLTDWATPRKVVVPRAKPVGTMSSEFDRLLLRPPIEALP